MNKKARDVLWRRVIAQGLKEESEKRSQYLASEEGKQHISDIGVKHRESRERLKEKQRIVRELKSKCDKDEHGHTLYLSTISLQTKVEAYHYKNERFPVGFYCPICGELYNLKCKKCE
ncbi:hypothetical protein LCGC14_0224010 [marine sediment metagenome]|uniref:Uncharacterized protein n=1 Tax=marine sediment metagenome TaxID=412755 RepID=A0A0F9XG12_9ZZZZ